MASWSPKGQRPGHSWLPQGLTLHTSETPRPAVSLSSVKLDGKPHKMLVTFTAACFYNYSVLLLLNSYRA